MEEKTFSLELLIERPTDKGWQVEPIKLSLEEDFSIDDNNLDAELCKAGTLLVKYGNLAAELKAQVARKKDELENTEAFLSQNIRNSTDKKLTENTIREKVVSEKERREKKSELILSESQYQHAENLYRSQQKRVDVLISICYKQRSEISRGAF